MLWIAILTLSLIGAGIHARLHARRPGPRRGASELFLVYILAGYYGVGMVLSALVHLSNPRGLAELKAWPASEPFQALYAFALLGLAVSAFLGVWWRGRYLLGPAIAGSVLLLGGAYVHGSELLRAGRVVWSKDGPELLLDLVLPIGVLVLAYAHDQGIREGVERVSAAEQALPPSRTVQ